MYVFIFTEAESDVNCAFKYFKTQLANLLNSHSIAAYMIHRWS